MTVETDAQRAHRLANQCQVLMGSNDELLEALEGLTAAVGKMKPPKGESFGHVVAELCGARTAIENAKT